MGFDQWIQLGLLIAAIGGPLAAMHRQNLIRGEALLHKVEQLTTITEQHDKRTRKVRKRLKRLEQRIFPGTRDVSRGALRRGRGSTVNG